MLDSTIWYQRASRDLFITALLMARPHELREPTAQLQVDRLEGTGWTVPPGWYGFVAAAGPGIAARAQVDWTEARDALVRLGEPEPESRSQEFDGRRLVRVNGGYIVLNYDKYRTRDYGAAERMKRYRARLSEDQGNAPVMPGNGSGVTLRRHVTQAEAEAEAEVRTDTLPTEGSPLPSAEAAGKVLKELWNAGTAGTGLPRCLVVSKARARKCQARLQEHPVLWHREAIQRLAASAFCRGENDRGWVASFDWYIHNEDNALKVLEGKYDNRAVVKGRTAGNQQALRDVLAAMGGSGDETGG